MIEGLEHVVAVAGEHSGDVDRRARFPRESIAAMRETGLLGLTVPVDLGGIGQGAAAASEAITAVSKACASSGMILTMHLAAMAALRAGGNGRFDDVLRDAAAGRHLSTLALSERATRSNFWISMGQATDLPDGGAELKLEKSFVTSAGPANSYVVSAATPGRQSVDATDLFLVRVEHAGVEVLDWWQGSGLRGNSSAPMRFNCSLPAQARVGERAGGRDVLLHAILPWFQLGAASVSIGIATAAAEATREHVLSTTLEHLGQTLGDQPLVRFGLGQLYAGVDEAAGFVTSVARRMDEGTARLEHIFELKVVGNEVALTATDRAMRLGGGAAYSGKSIVERLFRDARAGMVMAPTADMLYDMIGRVVVGLPPI